VVGTGGIVSTGGTVGGGGTIVPGLAVFAGVPSGQGSADGTGAAARFDWPFGVAVDGAGNVFVADLENNTIRKITSSGVVTTLAGSAGLSGSADGTGAAARFSGPEGVAVDGAGNVFVADYHNNTIRKITPSGVVTTLAGTAGSSGSADGTGAAARFNQPRGVAVDGSGNVFVADSYNNAIRKITPNGVVTTLAGTAGSYGSADGTGATARFNNPSGVAVDGAGNVFVTDYNNTTIRKITPTGVVTTLAGSAGLSGSADGTGAAARFSDPEGVAVDGSGNVLVADWENNTIRKITPTGVVTTLAGTAGSYGSADGTGAAARFLGPSGAAVDTAGNVFVADSDNNTIRKITPTGVVTTPAGTAGSYGSADGTGAAARFDWPSGVAVDGAGNLFVADASNDTIRKITSSGVVTTLAGSAGYSGSADGTGAAARFNGPNDVAVDGAGNVFVADSNNNTIRKITSTGVVTTLAGSAAADPGSADGMGAAARFSYPEGVAVDGAGNVFVVDYWNSTIRKVTPAGAVTTFAGTAGLAGSADGTGAAARFSALHGVAVDGAGNVFVADTGNNTIRKITSSGVVTTLAGSAGYSGSADGTGAAARFNSPDGVAVDGAGNVFVADTDNNAIRKISTSGVVTTIVGVAAPASAGNLPGPLPASIVSPEGVAIDPSTGKLYITLPDAVMVAVLPK
jgi:sugar lactone lactonase YvrE